MKRFHFGLEGLRTARKAAKERRQAELADRERSLSSERDQLRKLGEKRDQSEARISRKLEDGFSASQAMLAHMYLEKISSLIRQQQDKVEGLAEEVDLCRVGLIEAARDEKAVDRLREKRLWDFVHQVSRMEQKELDEVGQRSKRVSVLRPAGTAEE